MAKEILLEMKGIDKSFPGVRALQNVDFTVHKGEIHALLGENGAGKSTLIKILTGIIPKDAGEIIFDGKEINPKTAIAAQREGISTIYQELNLVPYQTVYENLFLGRETRTKLGTVHRKKMIKDAEEVLGDMGIHVDVTKPLLSYGTAVQQMVAIGRAITINAKLVIMDEATSSLDSKEVEVLFEVIRKLKEKGIAVVFISHRLDEVFTICEQITVLKDGVMVGELEVSETDQLTLIKKMVGGEVKNLERKKEKFPHQEAEKLVTMNNICQGFRLNGIGIDIKKGEILGLAGLLGSGRTELAKVLFGAIEPDKGEILWLSEEFKLKSPKDAIKRGIGFCTEDRKVEGIIPHLSVKENITIALLPQISKLGVVSEKQQREIVDQYIQRLQIKTPSPNQTVRNLSGGNQQKVLLARWLCMNPKLVIVDEPTRGIDVGAKVEIEKLIQELASEGISVLMISSEIAELERNCDRVVVIRGGEKLATLIDEQIDQDVIMETIAAAAKNQSILSLKGESSA